MFDRVLKYDAVPKKGKNIPSFGEAFTLENSLEKSGNLNFLIFPFEEFGFII